MNSITYNYLGNLVARRYILIIVTAVICGAIAFGYCTFFATPVYKATSQVIISNGALIYSEEEDSAITGGQKNTTNQSKIGSSDITASIYLTNICVGILETPGIYKELADYLGGDYTYKKLMGCTTVKLKNSDEIFINISVESSSKEEAVRIAGAFAQLAPDYIYSYLPLANSKVTSIPESASQSSPRTMLSVMLFAVAGAVLAFVLALIIDLNDQTIKGQNNFTSTYDIPLLGVVPDFNDPIAKTGGYTDAV